MNNLLFQIYRILIPKPLRTFILKKNLRRKIFRHFGSLPQKEINEEQKEVLHFLKHESIRIFPYPFHTDYSPDKIEVFDGDNGMKYVLHEGKKLYFKKRWTKNRIRKSYCDLMREQDHDSPHKYLSKSFTVGNNDVIADIGAAEGNFSLSVIEKVRKVYIFEYDKEWIEALKATFAPWPGKVEIISKFVSDHNDASHTRFDTFFEERDVTFLKIDVDGAESIVLEGCNKILNSSKPLRLALCTYHKNNDEEEFTKLLDKQGFTISPSQGYMINYYDKKIKSPYLRRGLIRAERG